jgi:hypothetical protein
MIVSRVMIGENICSIYDRPVGYILQVENMTWMYSKYGNVTECERKIPLGRTEQKREAKRKMNL